MTSSRTTVQCAQVFDSFTGGSYNFRHVQGKYNVFCIIHVWAGLHTHKVLYYY